MRLHQRINDRRTGERIRRDQHLFCLRQHVRHRRRASAFGREVSLDVFDADATSEKQRNSEIRTIRILTPHVTWGDWKRQPLSERCVELRLCDTESNYPNSISAVATPSKMTAAPYAAGKRIRPRKSVLFDIYFPR